jgi:ribosome-binding protein aMBF1 (putative translation factor)
MGRPPGKEPSAETVQNLRALLERRRQRKDDWEQAVDELGVAVLRACEDEGASRSQLARALGVSRSTVQGWVDRGRQVVARG